MPTTQQISDIVAKVRKATCLRECEGIHLKVVSEKFDDAWLSIVVVPSKAGVRASEYANFMSKIEGLREQGDDNVLLVPALED